MFSLNRFAGFLNSIELAQGKKIHETCIKALSIFRCARYFRKTSLFDTLSLGGGCQAKDGNVCLVMKIARLSRRNILVYIRMQMGFQFYKLHLCVPLESCGDIEVGRRTVT